MTRPVVATLFMSLDGVVEDPSVFQFDSFDERMGELMGEGLAGVDDVILGRRSYQEWAAYWPANPGDPFADFINPVRKHVLSRTLRPEDVTWSGASLVRGEAVEFIRELAAGPGGRITVAGSASTVRELFLAGAIDELTLMIHPVVAGAGMRRLFHDDEATTRLRLLRHEATPAGNVVLTYALREPDEAAGD